MNSLEPGSIIAANKPISSYPALWRNKAFILLFTASTISLLGNAFHSLALSLWVLQETGSAKAMSILLIVNLIICSLLGSVTGTLADRFNRRRIILGAYFIQSIFVLGIAACLASPHPSFVLIVCLTGVVTAAGQFQGPAFQASLRCIAGTEHIQKAAGWMSLSENISRTAGYALGGIFVAAFGGTLAIVIDGMAFLAALLAVSLAGSFSSPVLTGGAKGQSFKQDILSGFRFIWRNPFAKAITILLPILSLFFLSSLMLTQVMAVKVWNATPLEFGLMEGCIPLGYMLGAGFIVATGDKLKYRGRVIIYSLLLIGPLYAVLSFTSTMWIAIPLILLIGFTFAFSTLLINIILRLEVPEDLQGRMFGVLGSLMSVAPPLGLAVFSSSADLFGPSSVMLAVGVMLLVFGIWAYHELRFIREYQ
ncbi:MFS transporter [Paenibacillus sp. sgz500958]|uniref:MFS transporter n=1 Tax=Paenibacillus sp. sgz500958 TaxID=3242475 RepID=UPI0036D43A4A